MEGWEARYPRAVPTFGKGKGKATVIPRPSPPAEKATSPHSLEALMADSILFKEPQLKDLKEEVITRVASVYRKAVTKKV